MCYTPEYLLHVQSVLKQVSQYVYASVLSCHVFTCQSHLYDVSVCANVMWLTLFYTLYKMHWCVILNLWYCLQCADVLFTWIMILFNVEFFSLSFMWIVLCICDVINIFYYVKQHTLAIYMWLGIGWGFENLVLRMWEIWWILSLTYLARCWRWWMVGWCFVK